MAKLKETMEGSESGEATIGIFIYTIDAAPVVGNNPRQGEDGNVHSRLYKLDMSSRYENLPLVQNTQEPLAMEPIWTFKGFPYGMSCVCVGSYLYFLGGSLDPYNYKSSRPLRVPGQYRRPNPSPNLDSDFSLYPGDVHVFDCQTCQLIAKATGDHHPPSMITGKSMEPFTFVDEVNKIYVLSSTNLVPAQLCMFEVFDPQTHGWTQLPSPPPTSTSLYKSAHPLGSLLVGSVIVVSFVLPNDTVVLHRYDISVGQWSVSLYDPFTIPYVPKQLRQISAPMPSFQRGSIVIHNTLYSSSLNNHLFNGCPYPFPVLSYDPIDLTRPDLLPVHPDTLTPIFPKDTLGWPIQGSRGPSSSTLVHLGGLLDGTNRYTPCFGYVEVYNPEMAFEKLVERSSFIRFVAFEAYDRNFSYVAGDPDLHLPDNAGPFFRARYFHASQFYSSVRFHVSRVTAAYAIRF